MNSGKGTEMGIKVVNILDGMEELGEEALKADLSYFVSEKNPEIEEFIREKAIEFAKRKLSITYLITDATDGVILGYFTLTHKSVILSGEGLSKTFQKKLAAFSRLDKDTGNYVVSAFLLAQLGKNYAVELDRRISGKRMMELVNNVLLDVQRRIGGGVLYLDCEDIPKLKDFYSRENFKEFADRFSSEDERKYIQFMRFL